MKKALKLTLAVALMMGATSLYAQKFGRINSQEIVMAMPETKEMQTNLETFGKELNENIETINVEFNNKLQEYQKTANTLTDAVREMKAKELEDLQRRSQEFQQTGRDMDDMTPEMPRRMDLDYVFRSRYEQGVFLELVFAQVERHGRLAFGSHADNEGIDPARIAESLHHRSAVRREAGAHQPEPAPAAGHRKQIVQGETRDRSLFVYLVHLTVR